MTIVGIGARSVLVGAMLMSAGCREPNVLPEELKNSGSGGADAERSVQPPAQEVWTTGTGASSSATVDLTLGFQPSSLCNIEFIDGKELDGNPRPVTDSAQIQGWLGSGDGSDFERPTMVVADAGGAIVRLVPMALDIKRPDVREAFPGQPQLLAKGFVQTLDSTGLPDGNYHLFLAYESDEQRFVCDNGRFITVR